jgi:hypothetical protein
MATVVVCGDREWADHEFLSNVLDGALRKLGPLRLVDGGNPGAEELAGVWAHHNRKNGVEHAKMDTKWRGFRKIPGVIRNRDMLALEPDLVVIFHTQPKPDTGLHNLKTTAQMSDIEVWVVPHPTKSKVK